MPSPVDSVDYSSLAGEAGLYQTSDRAALEVQWKRFVFGQRAELHVRRCDVFNRGLFLWRGGLLHGLGGDDDWRDAVLLQQCVQDWDSDQHHCGQDDLAAMDLLRGRVQESHGSTSGFCWRSCLG
jgi:hypothetical protein